MGAGRGMLTRVVALMPLVLIYVMEQRCCRRLCAWDMLVAVRCLRGSGVVLLVVKVALYRPRTIP